MKIEITENIGNRLVKLFQESNCKLSSGTTKFTIYPGQNKYIYKGCYYRTGNNYLSIVVDNDIHLKLFLEDILFIDFDLGNDEESINKAISIKREIKNIIYEEYKEIFRNFFNELELTKNKEKIKLTPHIVSYFNFDTNNLARIAAGVIVEETSYDYGPLSGKHYYADINKLTYYMTIKLLEFYNVPRIENEDLLFHNQLELFLKQSRYSNYLDFILRYINSKNYEFLIFFIISKEDKLLLTYDKKTKQWTLPYFEIKPEEKEEIKKFLKLKEEIKEMKDGQKSIDKDKILNYFEYAVYYGLSSEKDRKKLSNIQNKKLIDFIEQDDFFKNLKLNTSNLYLIKKLKSKFILDDYDIKITNGILVENNNDHILQVVPISNIYREIHFSAYEKLFKPYGYVFYRVKKASKLYLDTIISDYSEHKWLTITDLIKFISYSNMKFSPFLTKNLELIQNNFEKTNINNYIIKKQDNLIKLIIKSKHLWLLSLYSFFVYILARYATPVASIFFIVYPFILWDLLNHFLEDEILKKYKFVNQKFFLWQFDMFSLKDLSLILCCIISFIIFYFCIINEIETTTIYILHFIQNITLIYSYYEHTIKNDLILKNKINAVLPFKNK